VVINGLFFNNFLRKYSIIVKIEIYGQLLSISKLHLFIYLLIYLFANFILQGLYLKECNYL
jgi:hypothetical protein